MLLAQFSILRRTNNVSAPPPSCSSGASLEFLLNTFSGFWSSLPIRQVLVSCWFCPQRLFWAYMKKIYATKSNTLAVPPHRSFRRFVKRVFASFLKRQPDGNESGFQKEVMQKLRHIEELITREMTGRMRRWK